MRHSLTLNSWVIKPFHSHHFSGCHEFISAYFAAPRRNSSRKNFNALHRVYEKTPSSLGCLLLLQKVHSCLGERVRYLFSSGRWAHHAHLKFSFSVAHTLTAERTARQLEFCPFLSVASCLANFSEIISARDSAPFCYRQFSAFRRTHTWRSIS